MFNGLTRHQKLVLIIAWLGWVFDVMEASLFALTKQPMLTEMLGSEQYKAIGPQIESRIHVAMLLGWSLGGLFFGIVADRWGRSRTLILTIFLYCLFTGITSLCQTPEQVQVARFLTGLGIGGEWAAGAALIAETVPNDWRARAAAFLQTAAAIGSIVGVFVNLSIGGLNWRFVYVAGIVPAILCLVARYKLEPDTPAPLTKIGGVLQKGMPWRNLAIAATLGVIGITGGGLLPFWLPNLINEVVDKSNQVYWKNISMIILHLGTLAGVLIFPPLTDRYGRRPMFAVFGCCAAAMLFITANFGTHIASILILAPITSFFALGLTAGFGLYFPELFPKAFRATGSGVAYNLSRILSAPVPLWIGTMAKENGPAAAIGAAASIYVIMMIALIFAPETRGGVLEE